jgi:hypothetical protein
MLIKKHRKIVHYTFIRNLFGQLYPTLLLIKYVLLPTFLFIIFIMENFNFYLYCTIKSYWKINVYWGYEKLMIFHGYLKRF